MNSGNSTNEIRILKDRMDRTEAQLYTVNNMAHDNFMKTNTLENKVFGMVSTVECEIGYSTSKLENLENRVAYLEGLINKILPILPDDIKLYLELSEEE